MTHWQSQATRCLILTRRGNNNSMSDFAMMPGYQHVYECNQGSSINQPKWDKDINMLSWWLCEGLLSANNGGDWAVESVVSACDTTGTTPVHWLHHRLNIHWGCFSVVCTTQTLGNENKKKQPQVNISQIFKYLHVPRDIFFWSANNMLAQNSLHHYVAIPFTGGLCVCVLCPDWVTPLLSH